jgi:hypothetical protein
MIKGVKWTWQRLTRGFDDRELWSLDVSLASYIVPRLEAFKRKNVAHVVCPGSMEANFEEPKYAPLDELDDGVMLNNHWVNVLDTMIEGFRLIRDGDAWLEDDEQRKADRALCLFHKYYFDLWD